MGFVREARDEQTAVHQPAHRLTDTIALIAHQDDTMVAQGRGVDVVAIQEGSVNWRVGA